MNLRRFLARILGVVPSSLPVAYEMPPLLDEDVAKFRAFATSAAGVRFFAHFAARSQDLDGQATSLDDAAALPVACGVARGYRRFLLQLREISSDRSTPEADPTDPEGAQAAREDETP